MGGLAAVPEKSHRDSSIQEDPGALPDLARLGCRGPGALPWLCGAWGHSSPVSNLQDAVPEMPPGGWEGEVSHVPHFQIVAGGPG